MKPPSNFVLSYIIIAFVIVILILLLLIVSRLFKKTQIKAYKFPVNALSSTCSKDTCFALDPVNSPDYNQKQIIKQSILLEEHIAEKSKYCMSCCVKHFNHIIGLAEEGIWLAGMDVDKYPLLEEGATFYGACFEKWLAGRNDEVVKKEVLSILRNRRRDMIDVYFLESGTEKW